MRVHHLAFRTRDLARLERFYVGRLGLRVGKRSERSIWLRLGAGVLMLELAEPGEPTVPADSFELVAFAVDPPRRRALEDALGETIEARTEHTIYFRDPDGRRIAVSTHPLLGVD